jgi:hypothetical protein
LVNLFRTATAIVLGFSWHIGFAQGSGEESELTPEHRDAIFSSADADRVAAGFSDDIIDVSWEDPVKRMTDAADLVFQGTVLSQYFEYDEVGTPSTRTTFLISERMKGEYQPREMTLIQTGGPSSANSNLVMVMSTTRHFNVGEEELLFVDLETGNELDPLNTRILSRFRIFEDKVYDEDGYGMRVVPFDNGAKYTLQKSPGRNSADRFGRINIGSHSLKKNFVDDHGQSSDTNGLGGTGLPAPDMRTGNAGAVAVEDFNALIR